MTLAAVVLCEVAHKVRNSHHEFNLHTNDLPPPYIRCERRPGASLPSEGALRFRLTAHGSPAPNEEFSSVDCIFLDGRSVARSGIFHLLSNKSQIAKASSRLDMAENAPVKRSL